MAGGHITNVLLPVGGEIASWGAFAISAPLAIGMMVGQQVTSNRFIVHRGINPLLAAVGLGPIEALPLSFRARQVTEVFGLDPFYEHTTGFMALGEGVWGNMRPQVVNIISRQLASRTALFATRIRGRDQLVGSAIRSMLTREVGQLNAQLDKIEAGITTAMRSTLKSADEVLQEILDLPRPIRVHYHGMLAGIETAYTSGLEQRAVAMGMALAPQMGITDPAAAQMAALAMRFATDIPGARPFAGQDLTAAMATLYQSPVFRAATAGIIEGTSGGAIRAGFNMLADPAFRVRQAFSLEIGPTIHAALEGYLRDRYAENPEWKDSVFLDFLVVYQIGGMSPESLRALYGRMRQVWNNLRGRAAPEVAGDHGTVSAPSLREARRERIQEYLGIDPLAEAERFALVKGATDVERAKAISARIQPRRYHIQRGLEPGGKVSFTTWGRQRVASSTKETAAIMREELMEYAEELAEQGDYTLLHAIQRREAIREAKAGISAVTDAKTAQFLRGFTLAGESPQARAALAVEMLKLSRYSKALTEMMSGDIPQTK